jgi:hypothetical protein
MIPSGLLQNVREASTLANTQFRNGSINAQLYLDVQSAYLNALRASQNAVLDAWRTLLGINLLTGGGLETKQVNHEVRYLLSAGWDTFPRCPCLRTKTAGTFRRRWPRT